MLNALNYSNYKPYKHNYHEGIADKHLSRSHRTTTTQRVRRLKRITFFRWATLETKLYWRKVISIGLIGWLLTSPISVTSFSPQQSLVLFVLSNNLGAELGVVLIVAQLGLGWRYVGAHLRKKAIFYEESGWYDGQAWLKPPEVLVLTRDRLSVSPQVDPILQRIIRT